MSNMELSPPTIMVVGDVMLDSYINVSQVGSKSSSRFPYTFECNPKVQGGYNFALGGAGNVANNLASLGANVILISTIGDDIYGRKIIQLLEHKGIINDLIVDNRFTTTVKQRVTVLSSECSFVKNFRIDIERRDVCASDPEILSKILSYIEKGLDAVILSDYGKGMFCHTDLSKNIIMILTNTYSIPVFIDPKQIDISKYTGATLLKPNDIELENMLDVVFDQIDDDSIFEKCKEDMINKFNIKNVLVTRNSKGCIYINKDLVEKLPSMAKNACDPNGAGDSVLAMVALGLSCGLKMDSAVKFSNCCASLIVTKIGTHPLTIEEIEKLNSNCKESCLFHEEHRNLIGNIRNWLTSSGEIDAEQSH